MVGHRRVRAEAFADRGRKAPLLQPLADQRRQHVLLGERFGADHVTRARLRQANSFKSEILGTIAHDLKNPLGVILGRTEILKELIAGAGMRDENAQEQIIHIRDAANRLTGMVDDLVADAMADALDITIRREPVSISELVQEVAETNRPRASSKDQTITVSAADHYTAMCDSDRIREAMDNLVSNAVRYTPETGKIEVRWHQRAEGTGEIVVRDTGPGIAAEHLPRLTERFYRVDGSRSRDTGGTGLGLAIVKHVIQRHGGELLIESTPGQGSTFTLVLPGMRVRKPVAKLAVHP